eukprot:Pgem_evm1s15863
MSSSDVQTPPPKPYARARSPSFLKRMLNSSKKNSSKQSKSYDVLSLEGVKEFENSGSQILFSELFESSHNK